VWWPDVFGCWLGKVAYLFAEQRFSEKRYEDCIRELDVTQMPSLKMLPTSDADAEGFLDTSLQRLMQHACFVATTSSNSAKHGSTLRINLRDFLQFFMAPEDRAEQSAQEVEEVEKDADSDRAEPDEPADSADTGADFDAFDLSQHSPAEEMQADPDPTPMEADQPDSGPTCSGGGRATHEIAHPALKEKLSLVHALCNYENMPIEKVKGALAFATSDDALLARCSTSPLWAGLIDEVKGWVSENEMLHAFGQNLQARIGNLSTEVARIQCVSNSCCDLVAKLSADARDLGPTFKTWWANSWQKGELVTQAIEFLDEIEEAKKKNICNKGLGLACKVKSAKDSIQELLNHTFTMSSHLWWLTIRLIKMADKSTEAEPRGPADISDVFNKHVLMWEEMAEVLGALETFGIKMPRMWSSTIQVTDLRKAWFSFAFTFMQVSCVPQPHHAKPDHIAHMKAVAVAAVPTNSYDSTTLGERADAWSNLIECKDTLVRDAVRHLADVYCELT